MVGTLRSKGCENCRKRKRKCGEERPECGACITSGLTCPGFTQRWKFVNENPLLSSYYKSKHYILEEIDVSYRLSLDSFTKEDQAWPRSHSQLVIFPSLVFSHSYLISSLVYIMNDPKSQALCETQCLVSFISYLPPRLGRNMALDATVASFCGIHADVLAQRPDTRKRALLAYSKGLKALRACVEQPELRYESETICASIILQICEVLINKDGPAWVHLARGSKHLITASGPKRYAAPFENAMLQSQQTLFILQDIGNAQYCFLSQPEWRNVFRTVPEEDNSKSLPYLSLRAQFCDMLADINELLSELSEVPTVDGAQADTRTRLENNAIRAMRIIDNIEGWYSRNVEPLVLLSPSSSSSKFDGLEEDAAFVENYAPNYTDALIAILDCVSNFTIIKLEKMIQNLIWNYPQMNKPSSFSISPSASAKRHASLDASYQFLRIHSKHSVQPLSSALQQLCRIDTIIG